MRQPVKILSGPLCRTRAGQTAFGIRVAAARSAVSLLFPIAALPDDALYSWGWRVPFLASAVVVAVAFFVRRRLAEPPTFARLQEANEVAIVAIPLWGMLSDRVGRRPVFAFGALGAAVAVGVATVLLSGVIYSAPNAVWPALYAEIFDARVRYTGMAVSTQFANVALGVFPSIAIVMMKPGPLGWLGVAILLAGLNIIAAIAAFAGKETAFTPLADLGGGKGAEISATIRNSHSKDAEKAEANA
jgi:MFS family permease